MHDPNVGETGVQFLVWLSSISILMFSFSIVRVFFKARVSPQNICNTKEAYILIVAQLLLACFCTVSGIRIR